MPTLWSGCPNLGHTSLVIRVVSMLFCLSFCYFSYNISEWILTDFSTLEKMKKMFDFSFYKFAVFSFSCKRTCFMLTNNIVIG